jgi:lipoprotein-releasing system permease protein
LIIAIAGLCLSSFSLLVLQSIMGGLQNGLMERSKSIHGDAFLNFKGDLDTSLLLVKKYEKAKLKIIPEYQLELLLKHKNHLSPIILHGIDFEKYVPEYLENRDVSGTILGADLGTRINSYFLNKVTLISPTHLDYMLGDMPRQVSSKISDFVLTDLAEVDLYHAWVRIGLVQNITHERQINKVSFFKNKDYPTSEEVIEKVTSINTEFDSSVIQFKTWEHINKSLLWALRLESSVMIILFICMTLLVSISITSGFLIFYSKVKSDLMSFWILGLSKEAVFKLTFWFTHMISFIVSAGGIILGLAFLYVLDHFAPNIMPDVFVERKLPVNITMTGILISLFVPYFISVFFSSITLSMFKKENSSFLKLIRNIG